jgi:isopenicillin N synthase-like dioxygenase
LLVETAASADVPDWKEMLNWGHTPPAGHPLRRAYPHRYMEQVLPESAVPGITDVLTTFHDRVADVQRRFLRVIALSIGAHEDLFEQMLHHGATLTRAIHYPAMVSAPTEHHVWAGEHGDINLITALPRATAAGLQVRTEGGWVDAIAPEGRAIINTGMMLEQLTNGTIPTGMHRVVAAPGQTGDRYSVVQFCHPTPWTILAPLACCISPEHPQRFGAVEAGHRLDEVLWEINLIEDGRRVPSS